MSASIKLNTRINYFENLKILVADDDENTVAKVSNILLENGCQNVTGKSKILFRTDLEGFDIVILDIVWTENTKPKYQTNDHFGIDAAKYLQKVSPNCKVVLMSKYFSELDRLNEINPVCGGFFSSNEDAAEILQKILKIASIPESKSEKEGEIFSRDVLLAKHILKEVDGYDENKPSSVGIDNQAHSELLREIKSIIENQHKNNALLKESIDMLADSLSKISDTIRKSLRELFQGIIKMANEPKVQMSFINSPVSNATGNVEGDLVINPSPKTPEEAAKEIRGLLTYLQKSNPIEIEEATVNQEIARNPEFKFRLRNALKEAALETATLIFAPLGIGIAAIRGWRDAE